MVAILACASLCVYIVSELSNPFVILFHFTLIKRNENKSQANFFQLNVSSTASDDLVIKQKVNIFKIFDLYFQSKKNPTVV